MGLVGQTTHDHADVAWYWMAWILSGLGLCWTYLEHSQALVSGKNFSQHQCTISGDPIVTVIDIEISDHAVKFMAH